MQGTTNEVSAQFAPESLEPQKPIEGISLVYTFDDAKAPTRHATKYFEMTAQSRDLPR